MLRTTETFARCGCCLRLAIYGGVGLQIVSLRTVLAVASFGGKAWSKNEKGQLANGSNLNSSTPVIVRRHTQPGACFWRDS